MVMPAAAPTDRGRESPWPWKNSPTRAAARSDSRLVEFRGGPCVVSRRRWLTPVVTDGNRRLLEAIPSTPGPRGARVPATVRL